MEDIAGQVEVRALFRAHRARVDLVERHAAVGDDRAVVAHEPRDRDRHRFHEMHQLLAVLLAEAVHLQACVGELQERPDRFIEPVGDKRVEQVHKVFVLVFVEGAQDLPLEGFVVRVRIHIDRGGHFALVQEVADLLRAVQYQRS